jgi:hypothetical protein
MQFTHNIVGSLPAFNYHHAAALHRKSGLDLLQPKAHQPVALLDHDNLHLRIAEDSQPGFAPTIPAGASFPQRFHHPKAALGEELRQRGSCRSNSAFWPREETLAYNATLGGSLASAAWTITVPVASFSAGTGSLPAFHWRLADSLSPQSHVTFWLA